MTKERGLLERDSAHPKSILRIQNYSRRRRILRTMKSYYSERMKKMRKRN